MNWFTRVIVDAHDRARKQEFFERDSGCEHVEKDVSLAFAMRSENDSFGPVSTFVCCQACDLKAEEAEGNEECVCHDCKTTVKKKDGIEWKWYDFHAPQGDEPYFICNTCRYLEKHRSRVAKDQADYNWEFGNQDDEEEEDTPLSSEGAFEDMDPVGKCDCCEQDDYYGYSYLGRKVCDYCIDRLKSSYMPEDSLIDDYKEKRYAEVMVTAAHLLELCENVRSGNKGTLLLGHN
jgi:hypothetical protein